MKSIRTRTMLSLVSMFACWLIPSSTWASVEVDGIFYELYTSDKTAAVTSNPNKYMGAIIIPSNFVYDGSTYSVTDIGYGAFHDCTGLTSVKIPNSVTVILDAFSGCTGLTSLTIPSSVTGIVGGAFSFCSGLTSISVDANNTKYDSRGNCNAIIESSSNQLILGCKNTIIPNSVTSIGYGAFRGCTGLTSVTISNSVTSIGHYAFQNCTSLTSMTIGNSVKSIESYVFDGCTGLTTIAIPNSVTSIGESAFFGCTGLTSMTIGNSVNSIGGYAFCRCSGLTSISVDVNNTIYDSRDNCNAIIETATNQLILGCKNTIIPNSVTSIGSSAFFACTGLTSIEIPNSVTSIGDDAFGECTGLTSIEIPSSVTSIDDYTFMGCTGLTSVNIPNALIGTQAFSYCTSLTSLTIGNGVTGIGALAFIDCTALTSVTIGNSVISIGGAAFHGCSSLTSVTIPNSVTSIGDDAFLGCRSLTSIKMESETPVSISSHAFYGVNKSTCTLYVPYGSKSAYESAEYWNEFQNIVEYGEEPDTDISALDNVIYVEQTEGRIGGTTDIPVKLKNSLGVRGFQFAMELPEGAIINSWALSTNRLPSGATLNDKIATQKIEGNKITVACSLNYGDATFTGNDGEIATVNVTFGDDMEVGTYPIYLTVCDVTTASGVDEDLSDIKSTLVLEDYVVGDANGDGKVRIGDATTILNYIVGTTSDNFKEKAADANGDGKIRIGDATTILNIIVNQ